MKLHVACVVLLLALVGSPHIRAQDEQLSRDGNSLKAVLLFGWKMPKGGIRSLPADVRAAAVSYHMRQERFRSRLRPPWRKEWAFRMTYANHVAFERVVWSLFDGAGVGEAAVSFVEATPLPYEWEGMSEAPTAEAEGAQRYLAAHPNTRIAPYLHLFIAHRGLCAATFLDHCQECQERDAHLATFRAEVALAKQAQHPLVRFMARELEKRPTCYDQ